MENITDKIANLLSKYFNVDQIKAEKIAREILKLVKKYATKNR